MERSRVFGELLPAECRPQSPGGRARVIGVELTYVDGQTGRAEEMGMFECDLVIPATSRGGYAYGGGRFNVTLHTSDGDFGAQIYL